MSNQYQIEKIKKLIKGNRGDVSILIAVLILATVITIVFGISYIVVNLLKSSTELEGSLQAFYAADAGAERCLFEVFSGTTPGCGGASPSPISGSFTSNGSSYTAERINPNTIHSDGFNSNIRITRRVEVNF